jgi:hypothetical protein
VEQDARLVVRAKDKTNGRRGGRPAKQLKWFSWKGRRYRYTACTCRVFFVEGMKSGRSNGRCTFVERKKMQMAGGWLVGRPLLHRGLSVRPSNHCLPWSRGSGSDQPFRPFQPLSSWPRITHSLPVPPRHSRPRWALPVDMQRICDGHFQQTLLRWSPRPCPRP